MTNPEVRRVYLGLGSNLGNRLGNLQAALRHLAAEIDIDGVSALYESAPVGEPDQQPYFNAACTGLTTAAPDDLLRLAKAIEWALGRRPGRRWSSRPLDIDLLAIEGIALDTESLTIPHPRIAERAFVLLPLAELDPALRLPGGPTARVAAKAITQDGPRRIAGSEWPDLTYVGPPGPRPTTA